MHMPRFNLWRQVLAGSVLLFLLSGCGAIDYFFLTPPQDTARELAEAGTQAMEDEQYNKAINAFETLKDRYPFSPFATVAELGLADAYFLDENYSAAVTAYKEFEAIHPGHEAIPYVLFRTGVASYEQFTSIDRPQDNIREAIQYFRRVSTSFPDSEYAALADDYVKKCRRLIAEHEIYVADFYWRTENYGAAWLPTTSTSKTSPRRTAGTSRDTGPGFSTGCSVVSRFWPDMVLNGHQQPCPGERHAADHPSMARTPQGR